MTELDELDKKILVMLQENARWTLRDMATELNLSTTPIFSRIKRLEKEGVISKYTAIINPEKIGKKLYAFVHISLKDHSIEEVEKILTQLTSFEEVLECHYVTGDADFFLKVLTTDIESYNQFVTKKLFSVKNISNIRSHLSLEVKKNTTEISI
jgi:DNA-binding Lrp family transcriptional regulator